MPKSTFWKPAAGFAAGKGATVQQFVATFGNDSFQIEVAPWGEGRLRVNGLEIAHVSDRKDRREAFRYLKKAAENYLGAQKLPTGALTAG